MAKAGTRSGLSGKSMSVSERIVPPKQRAAIQANRTVAARTRNQKTANKVKARGSIGTRY